MDKSRLKDLLDAMIHGRITSGVPLIPSEMAVDFCSQFSDELSSPNDEGFHRYAAYRVTVSDLSKRISKHLEPEKNSDIDQLLLPGFMHLQSYYMVSRDGQNIGVPSHQVTDDEFDIKIEMYQSRSESYLKHIVEIKRYVKERNHKPE